jgi:predicted ATP-grasp superfamily ATP-dependent carboligase
MFPDARAAILALEAISDLIKKEIPLSELAEKAVEIEERVRDVFASLPPALPEPKTSDDEDDPMIL